MLRPFSPIFFTGLHDAVTMSSNQGEEFLLSLDPLVSELLALFFPHSREAMVREVGDPYSEAVAKLIMNKIRERREKEKNELHPYPEKIGKEYWKGEIPFLGLDAGSRLPWLIQSANRFRAAPPPLPLDPEWQRQLAMVKSALKNITDTQKSAVIFWAGGPGTITPPGIWLELAQEYMESRNVPLQKMLFVKAYLSQSFADAIIAVFDSKYTYWIRRPFMLDPSIKTIMPTPNHPSYPAGHSILSFTAATLLSAIFPENKEVWMELAQTASHSRVWGGIHFPIDIEAGNMQGEAVGSVYAQMMGNDKVSQISGTGT